MVGVRPKLANSNEWILRNAKNIFLQNFNFWAFGAKKANFGQFLAKMGKTGFLKKALETFFLRF